MRDRNESEATASGRADATTSTEHEAIATDATDVPEVTRFERALLHRPLARDAVLVGFLVGFYAGGMWLVTPLPAGLALGSGVLFAVLWLTLMEAYCWRRGTSMLRSIGDDPYEPLLDDRTV